MKTFKSLFFYTLLIFFIMTTNKNLAFTLLLLLILSALVDRVFSIYYLLFLVIIISFIRIFNLYENSKEIFLIIGIVGLLLKKHFIKILEIKNSLTEATTKNSYQIWGYFISLSLESIGIYGFLGYSYFLYDESSIGLLKILFLGVLYNYLQSNFEIKNK